MAYVPDEPVDFHMGDRRTHIKVDYDSYVANLGGRDPTDEWSRDSTSTEWTVNGVSIGDDRYELSLPGEVKAGDTVWLVWAVWSDGDSFGHDAGARIDFVTVHRDDCAPCRHRRSGSLRKCPRH